MRRVRFLEPITAAILSNRRLFAPHGMAGGAAGRTGLNYVLRAEGGRRALGPFERVEVRRGDVFIIETPGGGGYGAPRQGAQSSPAASAPESASQSLRPA